MTSLIVTVYRPSIKVVAVISDGYKQFRMFAKRALADIIARNILRHCVSSYSLANAHAFGDRYGLLI